MSRTCGVISRTSMTGLVAALVLAVSASAAAPAAIRQGVDVFQTSTNRPSVADFSGNPLPAGFFCNGSTPFSGQIPLVGVPLTTAPPGVTANGDTIVERLTSVNLGAGGAVIPVQVKALQLASSSPLDIACPGQPDAHFNVSACLCGNQPVTQIKVVVDQSCGCGHFNGQLSLNVCLTFTNTATGAVLGPVQQAIGLALQNVPWCPAPGPGEPVINSSFVVEGCDGTQVSLPGTSNFFPNWTCANQASGQTCLMQYANLTECHSANDPMNPMHQHCTNPMCDRQ